MDPNIWIVKLLITWTISSISYDTGISADETVANGQTTNVTEFIRHNDDPLTHMEMTSDRRRRRAPYSSLFDQGYDEFLRDHFKNSNENERKSNYRAKESESDESDENNESNSDERSEESEEKPMKNQHKSKSNAKLNRQKDHSPAKSKKSKHCKSEKRGNMLCSVCFDPKTDEKSESCSFSSEPKKKNYAYSTDNKYENKNRERESYEKGNEPDDEDGDDDEENENYGTDDYDEADDDNNKEKLEVEKGQRIPLPLVPAQRPDVPFNPRFYPPNGPYPNRPLPIRPIPVRPNPNYYGPPRNGPQVFPQQYRGAPVRLQVPPNSAVIRYRTIGSPNGLRHIRIITYPNGQTQTQVYNPGTAQVGQDLRTPRDVNTEEIVLRDNTKGLYHFGGGSNDNKKLGDFLMQDWTNCKRFYDSYDEQVCFECVKDGSRGKQCIYAGQSNKKPESFYTEYSTSKKVENDEPYAFDRPTSSPVKHRTKQKHQRKQKPEKDHNSSNNNSNFGKEPAPVYERNAYDWKGIDYNAKQQQLPHAEQLQAGTSDIIYGKIISGQEPLGLFFNKDFGHFNTTTNTEQKNNIKLD